MIENRRPSPDTEIEEWREKLREELAALLVELWWPLMVCRSVPQQEEEFKGHLVVVARKPYIRVADLWRLLDLSREMGGNAVYEVREEYNSLGTTTLSAKAYQDVFD